MLSSAKIVQSDCQTFIFLFFYLFSFRLKPLFLRDFQPKSDAHPNSPCLLGGLFVDNLLAQHASMFAKTWIDCGKCTHFGLFSPFFKSRRRADLAGHLGCGEFGDLQGQGVWDFWSLKTKPKCTMNIAISRRYPEDPDQANDLFTAQVHGPWMSIRQFFFESSRFYRFVMDFNQTRKKDSRRNFRINWSLKWPETFLRNPDECYVDRRQRVLVS